MRPVVVLGLMGAGKSTVATALAAAIGRRLRDSDVDIEAATGRTAAAIARDSVEDLHRLEADQLQGSLRDSATVVAAAASVVDVAQCREAMREALVVWLDAPVDVLAARFHSGPHRPVYGADVAAVLKEQLARRGPLFEQVADLRVDAARPVEQIVRDVVAAVDARAQGGAR